MCNSAYGEQNDIAEEQDYDGRTKAWEYDDVKRGKKGWGIQVHVRRS